MQTASIALCPHRPALVMIQCWAAWLGRRAEGEWPRCSPAKFKEKGPLTLPAPSSSQAVRADTSAGRTQRPKSELSGPAQLCSCLLCLAAEAVAAEGAHSCSTGGFIYSL